MIPSQIRDLGVEDQHIHCMVVAPPGFGKTVFAGTAPNALFLTTDPEGTVSALAQGSTAKEWRIKSWTELNEAFRWLRDGGIAEMKLKWVIIDNASEAQNLGMFETMANARKNNNKLDEFVPAIQDYQRSQLMMKDMVKKFNDLPVNILWTAWVTHEEDADGESFYGAAIHGQQGSVAQTILGYMNVIGMGQVVTDDNGKDIRRLHFSNHGPYRGKDRFNVLGRHRDGLNVEQMQTLIEAAMKKYRSGGAVTTTKKAAPVRRTAAATRRKA